MITRRYGFPRQYSVYPAYRDTRPGLIRQTVVNGVPVSWPVARPGGMYYPYGAPHYLRVPGRMRGQQNVIHRQGGELILNLPRYTVEADPSDPTTWQRPYRFTR